MSLHFLRWSHYPPAYLIKKWSSGCVASIDYIRPHSNNRWTTDVTVLLLGLGANWITWTKQWEGRHCSIFSIDIHTYCVRSTAERAVNLPSGHWKRFHFHREQTLRVYCAVPVPLESGPLYIRQFYNHPKKKRRRTMTITFKWYNATS